MASTPPRMNTPPQESPAPGHGSNSDSLPASPSAAQGAMPTQSLMSDVDSWLASQGIETADTAHSSPGRSPTQSPTASQPKIATPASPKAAALDDTAPDAGAELSSAKSLSVEHASEPATRPEAPVAAAKPAPPALSAFSMFAIPPPTAAEAEAAAAAAEIAQEQDRIMDEAEAEEAAWGDFDTFGGVDANGSPLPSDAETAPVPVPAALTTVAPTLPATEADAVKEDSVAHAPTSADTFTLALTGMTCHGCVRFLTPFIAAIPGVRPFAAAESQERESLTVLEVNNLTVQLDPAALAHALASVRSAAAPAVIPAGADDATVARALAMLVKRRAAAVAVEKGFGIGAVEDKEALLSPLTADEATLADMLVIPVADEETSAVAIPSPIGPVSPGHSHASTPRSSPSAAAAAAAARGISPLRRSRAGSRSSSRSRSRAASFDGPSAANVFTMTLSGMTCHNCVRYLGPLITQLPGVRPFEADETASAMSPAPASSQTYLGVNELTVELHPDSLAAARARVSRSLGGRALSPAETEAADRALAQVVRKRVALLVVAKGFGLGEGEDADALLAPMTDEEEDIDAEEDDEDIDVTKNAELLLAQQPQAVPEAGSNGSPTTQARGNDSGGDGNAVFTFPSADTDVGAVGDTSATSPGDATLPATAAPVADVLHMELAGMSCKRCVAALAPLVTTVPGVRPPARDTGVGPPSPASKLSGGTPSQTVLDVNSFTFELDPAHVARARARARALVGGRALSRVEDAALLARLGGVVKRRVATAVGKSKFSLGADEDKAALTVPLSATEDAIDAEVDAEEGRSPWADAVSGSGSGEIVLVASSSSAPTSPDVRAGSAPPTEDDKFAVSFGDTEDTPRLSAAQPPAVPPSGLAALVSSASVSSAPSTGARSAARPARGAAPALNLTISAAAPADGAEQGDVLKVKPETTRFRVTGMTCGSCVSFLDAALAKLPGVESASVSLLLNRADVTHTAELQPEQIAQYIKDKGFDAEPVRPELPAEARARLRVTGMTCGSCVAFLEGALNGLDGINSAVVALLTERADVKFAPSKIMPQGVADFINSKGFTAEVVSTDLPAWALEAAAEEDEDEDSAAEDDEEDIEAGADAAVVHQGLPASDDRDDGGDATDHSGIAAYTDIDGEAPHQSSAVPPPPAPAHAAGGGKKRARKPRRGTRAAAAALSVENASAPRARPTSPAESDDSPAAIAARAQKMWLGRLYFTLIFAIPVFLIAMIFPLIPPLNNLLMASVVGNLSVMAVLLWALATPVQFGTGRHFFRAAWAGVRNGHANMSFLISIGSLAAYSYSAIACIIAALSKASHGGGHGGLGANREHFFETSSTMITIVVFGQYIEHLAKGKTSEALLKLMELQAPSATVITLAPVPGAVSKDGAPVFTATEREVAGDDVMPGDLVRLVRGARVPADCEVVDLSAEAASRGGVLAGSEGGGSGSSSGTSSCYADESMLTGESLPVLRRASDALIGGTVITDGVAVAVVRRIGADTTLSQIVRLVQDAQASKAPISAFADRISSVFVPAIICVAAVTFSVWLLLGSFNIVSESTRGGASALLWAFMFGVSVIVIACPCALGLATPTAVMVGTGVGASLGVLIKGGAALEMASKVSCLVFDKTGTLTVGKPLVTDFSFVDAPEDVAGISAAAASNSGASLTSLLIDALFARSSPGSTFSFSPLDIHASGPAVSAAVAVTGSASASLYEEACAGPQSSSLHSASAAAQATGRGIAAGQISSAQSMLFSLVGAAEANSGHFIGAAIKSFADAVVTASNESEPTALPSAPSVPSSFALVSAHLRDYTVVTARGVRTTCDLSLAPPEGAPAGSSPADGVEVWLPRGPLEAALRRRNAELAAGGAAAIAAAENPAADPWRGVTVVAARATESHVPVIVRQLVSVPLVVGNGRFLVESGIPTSVAVSRASQALESQCKTVVHVALAGRVRAVTALADAVKPEAAAMVTAARDAGLPVFVLTGDNPRAAAAVAAVLGIPRANVHASLTPENKLEHIQRLQSQGWIVGFVGDGINDSPSLAQAHLGIALGAGTDIAVEAADMVLVRNDLRDVLTAMDLARATMRCIKWNFVWALGYNTLSIPVAAGVFFPLLRMTLPPELAALAMGFSSISVLANSLRLKRYRRPDFSMYPLLEGSQHVGGAVPAAGADASSKVDSSSSSSIQMMPLGQPSLSHDESDGDSAASTGPSKGKQSRARKLANKVVAKFRGGTTDGDGSQRRILPSDGPGASDTFAAGSRGDVDSAATVAVAPTREPAGAIAGGGSAAGSAGKSSTVFSRFSSFMGRAAGGKETSGTGNGYGWLHERADADEAAIEYPADIDMGI